MLVFSGAWNQDNFKSQIYTEYYIAEAHFTSFNSILVTVIYNFTILSMVYFYVNSIPTPDPTP